MPSKCDRCQTETTITQMSRFNTDILCPECIHEEKEAPGYQRAYDTETAAVEANVANYPGIGLDPLDLGFVCGRMRLRVEDWIVWDYARKHGYPYPERKK